MGRIPGRRECYRLLEQHAVPPHIQRHSEQVARVALYLGRELNAAPGDEHQDLQLVEAAALLHDVAKAPCIESGLDHALEGARVLRELGFSRVAVLVERHVALGDWRRDGPVTEAELLNYSDKRVRHEEVVSLEERFLDLLDRYGGFNDQARARIRRNWEDTRAVERKIFDRLAIGPEAVLPSG